MQKYNDIFWRSSQPVSKQCTETCNILLKMKLLSNALLPYERVHNSIPRTSEAMYHLHMETRRRSGADTDKPFWNYLLQSLFQGILCTSVTGLGGGYCSCSWYLLRFISMHVIVDGAAQKAMAKLKSWVVKITKCAPSQTSAQKYLLLWEISKWMQM